jgi:hypothetical protein
MQRRDHLPSPRKADPDHRDPHGNEPCPHCRRFIRLGPEALEHENPRWCGECNFDLSEFARLRAQDEILGLTPRTKYRPARIWPEQDTA